MLKTRYLNCKLPTHHARTHRQEESSDDGTVYGEYSYVNAEGNEISVRYRASQEGGFEILNEEELKESVAKATADGAAAAAAARTSEHRRVNVEKTTILNSRAQQQQQQDLDASSSFASSARVEAGIRAPAVGKKT